MIAPTEKRKMVDGSTQAPHRAQSCERGLRHARNPTGPLRSPAARSFVAREAMLFHNRIGAVLLFHSSCFARDVRQCPRPKMSGLKKRTFAQVVLRLGDVNRPPKYVGHRARLNVPKCLPVSPRQKCTSGEGLPPQGVASLPAETMGHFAGEVAPRRRAPSRQG